MDSLQIPQQKSFLSQLQDSVAAKLFLIGVLTLLLLIPSSWIQSLISEREQRQEEAINEISEKWAGSQLIESPVMQLPYKTSLKVTDAAGKVTFKEVISTIYILPENLNIQSQINPQELKRGIFTAVVYNARIKIKGGFSQLELKKSGINPDMIDWSKVKITAGISDFKGLKSNPVIRLGDSLYTAEPDFSKENLFSNSLAIQTNLTSTKNTSLDFNIDMELAGSGELNFLHLGKNTTVNVAGKWDNPSFTGSYLPEKRNTESKDFTGAWKMSNFSRPFPQQWEASNNALTNQNKEKATFGIKFLLPVDHYQKATRSAKYAILIILLSFISLFFIELLNKVRVNLLQYVLIGAAMIIYYSLLLSFTERVGFAVAYLVASVSTIVLISTFIGAFLSNRKAAAVFAVILSIFYIFIYVIIQLQDLALLFGSIGLFITVACLMYFSVKINHNKPQSANA
ncbi:cell envelope integrity protein CreD [Pedobacter frigoris]|uniref:Cell envelope integrity protein CreD n=1 Tax=Pedobacter frigoris TaxID=2571272 RepID=A0A4U1CKG4_9SPHI|nr:cell envelope integrity protein CreD [Pedobacter frigoris]TKC07312.1 cell envelope integrity protein CreD [Pedobacter frigoris]